MKNFRHKIAILLLLIIATSSYATNAYEGKRPFTLVLDAGHGGSDFGATFEGRREKDDNLALTLAVGEILAENGVNVLFTRTTDIYETPTAKAPPEILPRISTAIWKP